MRRELSRGFGCLDDITARVVTGLAQSLAFRVLIRGVGELVQEGTDILVRLPSFRRRMEVELAGIEPFSTGIVGHTGYHPGFNLLPCNRVLQHSGRHAQVFRINAGVVAAGMGDRRAGREGAMLLFIGESMSVFRSPVPHIQSAVPLGRLPVTPDPAPGVSVFVVVPGLNAPPVHRPPHPGQPRPVGDAAHLPLRQAGAFGHLLVGEPRLGSQQIGRHQVGLTWRLLTRHQRPYVILLGDLLHPLPRDAVFTPDGLVGVTVANPPHYDAVPGVFRFGHSRSATVRSVFFTVTLYCTYVHVTRAHQTRAAFP